MLMHRAELTLAVSEVTEFIEILPEAPFTGAEVQDLTEILPPPRHKASSARFIGGSASDARPLGRTSILRGDSPHPLMKLLQAVNELAPKQAKITQQTGQNLYKMPFFVVLSQPVGRT